MFISFGTQKKNDQGIRSLPADCPEPDLAIVIADI
jgi:hypothetical protein